MYHVHALFTEIISHTALRLKSPNIALTPFICTVAVRLIIVPVQSGELHTILVTRARDSHAVTSGPRVIANVEAITLVLSLNSKTLFKFEFLAKSKFSYFPEVVIFCPGCLTKV